MLLIVVRRGYRRFRDARRIHPQTHALDLQCIAWMLQTSLNKAVHLLTLKLLVTVTTLVDFDPVLVSACFGILTGCVSTGGGKMVTAPGSEELAAVSALCCLNVLSHSTTLDPASGVFKDIQRRYTGTFPIESDFEGHPSYHHLCIIHHMFYPSCKWSRSQGRHLRRLKINWEHYKQSSSDHVILIHLARFEYQRKQRQKVPRWILRFARHILSQEAPPPDSVVTNCLSIVAIDLGCAVLNATALDEGYVRT